jgi:hypothetical protein
MCGMNGKDVRVGIQERNVLEEMSVGVFLKSCLIGSGIVLTQRCKGAEKRREV